MHLLLPLLLPFLASLSTSDASRGAFAAFCDCCCVRCAPPECCDPAECPPECRVVCGPSQGCAPTGAARSGCRR